MVLLVSIPPTYSSERRYIIDVMLSEFLGLEYRLEVLEERNVIITLIGDTAPKRIVIVDGLFATPQDLWLTPRSAPRLPLFRWRLPAEVATPGFPQEPVLPILFGESTEAAILRFDGDSLYLGVDIFGSCFYFLTLYGEMLNPNRDEHGRPPTADSVAFKEGLLHRPLVNEYLEILWWAISRQWNSVRRKHRQYQVTPTHDVDLLSLLDIGVLGVAKSTIVDLAIRREPDLAWRRLKAFIATKRHNTFSAGDPYLTFDFLICLSEEYGLRSSFNFVAVDSPHKHKHDALYEIDHHSVRTLMQMISRRGHYLGFHASYDSSGDRAKTTAEWQRLKDCLESLGVRQEKWGGRQHCLRWENPGTWRCWDEAGLDFDSTVAFSDTFGFRCGTCYEYPVFDLIRSERLRLRERPLIAMECALLRQQLGDERVLAEMRSLARVCQRYCGEFVFLWHNHMLISRGSRNLYAKILSEILPGASPLSTESGQASCLPDPDLALPLPGQR